MATLTLNVKDALFTAALATFPGADDTERTANMRQEVRQMLRERARTAQIVQRREADNASMATFLASLDTTLGDTTP